MTLQVLLGTIHFSYLRESGAKLLIGSANPSECTRLYVWLWSSALHQISCNARDVVVLHLTAHLQQVKLHCLSGKVMADQLVAKLHFRASSHSLKGTHRWTQSDSAGGRIKYFFPMLDLFTKTIFWIYSNRTTENFCMDIYSPFLNPH